MARLVIIALALALLVFFAARSGLRPSQRPADSAATAATGATTGTVPSAGTIEPVGNLRSMRAAHTATAISGDRVLFAGGMAQGGSGLRSAEVFDTQKNRVATVVEMREPRAGHSATLLGDGRVLIAGGYNGSYLRTAEIFDPESGQFQPAGTLREGRSGHTATLLEDGSVLLVGGVGDGWTFLASAEIYHPDTQTFEAVGALQFPRESHTATLLSDGRVLVIGGHRGRRERIEIYRSTEIYDPASRAFREGPSLNVPRHKHDATSLDDGRVLVLAGSDARDKRNASTEIYDPKSGSFTVGPRLGLVRHKIQGTAVRLASGEVLVAAGARRAELFDPTRSTFAEVQGDFGDDYSFATATLLPGGDVLIAGGYADGNRNTDGIWRFRR